MKKYLLFALLCATACSKPSTETPQLKETHILSNYASMAKGPIQPRTEQIASVADTQYQPEVIVGYWRLKSMTNGYHQTETNANPCWADDYIEIFPAEYNSLGTLDGQFTISQGECVQFAGLKEQNISGWYRWLGDNTVNFAGDTVRISFLFGELRLDRPDPHFLNYTLLKGHIIL